MGNLVKETPLSEITATLEILSQHGIGRRHLTKLRSDPGFIEQVAKALLGGLYSKKSFAVIVTSARSFEQMVAVGRYDHVDGHITAKNFAIVIQSTVEIQLDLVHFDRVMESSEVLSSLDAQGLRPASLAELLAFGEIYPEMQREFPVAALGSTWRHWYGCIGAPCLYGVKTGRSLSLTWLNNPWQRYQRFAAVEKAK